MATLKRIGSSQTFWNCVFNMERNYLEEGKQAKQRTLIIQKYTPILLDLSK
jgi:hypothetical protein